MSRIITLHFDLDSITEELFLSNAIERVINTSIRIADGDDDEDAGINVDDWNEWKPIIVAFWGAMHDAVFRARRNMHAQDSAFRLRKGEYP